MVDWKASSAMNAEFEPGGGGEHEDLSALLWCPQASHKITRWLKMYLMFRGIEVQYACKPISEVFQPVSKMIIQYLTMANITTFDIMTVKAKVSILMGHMSSW